MTKSLLITLFAVALAVPAVSATTAQNAPVVPAPQAPPAGPPMPPGPPPQTPRTPINVQLDIVITDTISGTPEAKTLTLVMGSGANGSMRTAGHVMQHGRAVPVRMAVDANVALVAPDLVEAFVAFEYQAASAVGGEASDANPAEITERVRTYVRNGQRVLVSRSADPVTNRTVTVELTATIREP